ncbi:TY-Chap domain-containing protein [Xanthobacteraceae bacterium A53D]
MQGRAIVFGLVGVFCQMLAAGADPVMAQASPVEARAQFIAQVACEIERRLLAVAATPEGKDRFVVASRRSRPDYYVQCILKDGSLLCEATSGFYGTTGRVTLTPRLRAILAAEGFGTDGSEGNFQRLRPLDDVPAETRAAAGATARLLYDMYGARKLDDLNYKTPLKPELNGARLCGAPAV